MNVKIIKPDATLYEGKATLLQLPGTGGLFEILDNHAPIISSLTEGKIRLLDEQQQEKLFDIRGGVVKGQQNDILLLVQ
ncbi:MAG: F0F1 ATP synthase subunit epsilon [Bacteroidales bacterium]|jgi:F-type H+-transporting ATPase subunit epsilon|nr:F0F1 ATP synthase subunit epsilon [Bacteroidales bacterium]